MTQALRDDQPEASSQLPADLPVSTVSEIASWLVGQPLDAVERELIRHTLESCGGDRALTASVLGISLPALRKKIRAYSVRGEPLPDSFEPAKEAPQAANDSAPQSQGTAAVVEETAEAAVERQSETVAEEVVEPAPTLTVPEPDNDPSLTLVETDAAPESPAAQPEPEIPSALVIAPEAASAETVAVVAAPAETVAETPKLIAGIATPRTKQKKNYAGPVAGGTLVLLLAAPIVYGLFSTQEKSKAIDVDRNRLEVTAIESPRFEQRIQVPVWTAPAARTEPVMPVDIAADRRAPAAVSATGKPKPVPVVAAVESEPAASVAAPVAPVATDGVSASAPEQTVADFNAELGTEMELGPVDIAADVAMDLGPVNQLADVRMELGPTDIAADTRMDLGPVDILADVRMELADAPETTGSIPEPTFFVAPASVPLPLARGEVAEADVKPVRRLTGRPARAAPAPFELPSPPESFPLPFPFSLFAPKGAQAGTAAASSPQPVDCCIR